MKLLSNTGDAIELLPVNNTKKVTKLLDPLRTKVIGILRYLKATSAKRADLANAFGDYNADHALKSLKHWGLVSSSSTYYTITDLGEKYYEIIKNKNFEKFYEID